MKPEIYDLFNELSGIPSEQRERYYVAHSTAEDLRDELESLFSFDSGPPVGNIVQRAVGLVFQEPVAGGDYCGPFRLLRLIGRGGMGIVYLAERTDGEVRQRVAIKLLRTSLDSSAARQRFLQERQILANLAHPNIARLIDAGHRADGQPYLVMEYIEGQPIDQYCATLALREKIVMFATVCDAIASAHRSLVVHRDLKPANILVDDTGRPHVLDFGIAKLMDDAEATETIERRLTPEYASPEQSAGAPVATATDIYSLGAVLHKLLAGEAPKRETPPHSRLSQIAGRDLEAIVLKAIRSEPQERYATADKLAEDLRAWIDHRPVGARQGERWYRARRHFRRYWIVAAAGALAASGLIAGFVTARSERDLAQQRFDEARKLANEFLALDNDLRAVPGTAALRERMVTTSIKYLENLSKRAGNDWRLKAEIAAGYRLAAEAQGIFRHANLGRPEDAEQSLNKAAALLAEASVAAPDDRKILHDRIELAELRIRNDTPSVQTAEIVETRLRDLQALLSRYEATAKDDAADPQFLGEIYNTMTLSATSDLSRMDLPVRFAQRTLELQRKRAARDTSITAGGALANALVAYGNVLRSSGDLNGAAEAFQESLTVLERLTVQAPNHYSIQVTLANVHALLARVLCYPEGPSLRQTETAIEHLNRSLNLSRQLMASDANEIQIRYNHSIAAWRLGEIMSARDPRASLAKFDEAITILRTLKPKYNRDLALAEALAESTFLLRTLDRSSESNARIQEAARICEPYRPDTSFTGCGDAISRAVAARALANGQPLQAVAEHRKLLKLAELNKTPDSAKENIIDADWLTNRYRLLRVSLLAAGLTTEADEIEAKRRDLVTSWKSKLSGRNDAEILLR